MALINAVCNSHVNCFMKKMSLKTNIFFAIVLILNIENLVLADVPGVSEGVSSGTQISVQMEVPNECAGMKNKPFQTYQKFYFKDDGSAYGVKSGQEVKLKLDDSYKKFNEDGSLNYVETLTRFKLANGISEDICNANTNSELVVSNLDTSSQSSASSKTQCNIKGEIDSVVLAMSWQPAFCESKGSKPECSLSQFLSEDSYQAKNFTLHGLWPNKNACGTSYGFCGEVSVSKNFCDYPEVNIATHTVEKELEIIMPSKAAGSCLERHEWYKHGTCQSLDTSRYFDRALRLVKEFNQSKTADLVRKHIKNSKLKKSDLLKAIDSSFGSGASKHFIIVCQKKMLSEIQVLLTAESVDPKTDDVNVTIKDLLNKSSSAKGYIRGCGEDITIDPIGPG